MNVGLVSPVRVTIRAALYSPPHDVPTPTPTPPARARGAKMREARWQIVTPSGFHVPGQTTTSKDDVPLMTKQYAMLMGRSWDALSDAGYRVEFLPPRT